MSPCRLICIFVYCCLEGIISWFKILNFKPQAIVFGSTDTFVSDLIGSPEYRLSWDVVQMIVNEPRHKETNIYICENKDADQLRSNCAADQRLCFCYTVIQSLYIRNLKPLAIFCGCTSWFVSDQVKNPEDRFCHNEAHIIVIDP